MPLMKAIGGELVEMTPAEEAEFEANRQASNVAMLEDARAKKKRELDEQLSVAAMRRFMKNDPTLKAAYDASVLSIDAATDFTELEAADTTLPR